MRLTWALLSSRPSRRATVSFLRSASSSPISSWSHAESWATLLGLDRPESRTASAVRFWRTVSPRYRAPVTSSRSTATPRALMMRSVSHCFCTQSGGMNAGEPPLNLHLRDHILLAILFEKLPFCGVMLGQVAGPLSVGLCGLARYAEIADEGLASVELLFVLGEPQGLASGIQARRVATVEAMEHGASAIGWGGRVPRYFERQPHSKGGVVGVLDVLRAGDGLDQPRGEPLPPGQVDDFNRRTIQAERKE